MFELAADWLGWKEQVVFYASSFLNVDGVA
jgi:hypothetical protein